MLNVEDKFVININTCKNTDLLKWYNRLNDKVLTVDFIDKDVNNRIAVTGCPYLIEHEDVDVIKIADAGFSSTKHLKLISEDIILDVKNKEDCVEAILEEYHRNDICIETIFQWVEIQGFPVNDVVDIYAKVMYVLEQDEIVQIQELESDTHNIIKRWEW